MRPWGFPILMAPCGPLYFGCENPQVRRPSYLRGGRRPCGLRRGSLRARATAPRPPGWVRIRPGLIYFCMKFRDLQIDRNFPLRTESNFMSAIVTRLFTSLNRRATRQPQASCFFVTPGHFVHRGFFMGSRPENAPAPHVPDSRLHGSGPKTVAPSHDHRLLF